MGRRKLYKLSYTVRVNPDVMDDFSDICKEAGLNKTQEIEDLLVSFIEKNGHFIEAQKTKCNYCGTIFRKMMVCPNCGGNRFSSCQK